MIQGIIRLLIGIIEAAVKGIALLIDHPQVGIPVAALVIVLVVLDSVPNAWLLFVALALFWFGARLHRQNY
jgi:hypothetical protein